jgi:hypothetical protein
MGFGGDSSETQQRLNCFEQRIVVLGIACRGRGNSLHRPAVVAAAAAAQHDALISSDGLGDRGVVGEQLIGASIPESTLGREKCAIVGQFQAESVK